MPYFTLQFHFFIISFNSIHLLSPDNGAVNPNGVGFWTLSRYDQKPWYNKNSTVTAIMSIKKMLCGILEANDGSICFGSMNGVYLYNGKTIINFKAKEEQK